MLQIFLKTIQYSVTWTMATADLKQLASKISSFKCRIAELQSAFLMLSDLFNLGWKI